MNTDTWLLAPRKLSFPNTSGTVEGYSIVEIDRNNVAITTASGNTIAEITNSSVSITHSLYTLIEPFIVSTTQPRILTIDDLGWTKEKAIAVRGLFSSIAEDWDDAAMDVYDEHYHP